MKITTPATSLTFCALLLISCGRQENVHPRLSVTKARIEAISIAGKATGKGRLVFPSGNTTESPVMMNIVIDWKNQGILAHHDWVVKNAVQIPTKNWEMSFGVTFPDPKKIPEHVGLIYEFTTAPFATDRDWTQARNDPRVHDAMLESNTLDVPVETKDVGDLMDLTSSTEPAEAMKGPVIVAQVSSAAASATLSSSASPAQKPAGSFTTWHSETPDITQGKNECAPAAAADSIIRLAAEHKRYDAIPLKATDMIEKLKAFMQWTIEDGVLASNFSPTPDFFAANLRLPIYAATVTGNGRKIFDAVNDAMLSGAVAELRLQGRSGAGHMVTVVGATELGSSLSFSVHDPLSPVGTDIYFFDPATGELLNYPYLFGTVKVTGAFTQTWVESADGL